MNERTKAALIGGVIAGVLSGLPVVGGCCFLWAIAGGFLTVFLYMKNAPGQLQMGDAAKLGLIAGAIGAVISLVLGIPFMLLGVGAAAIGNSNLPNTGAMAGIMAVGGIVGLILRAAIVAGFGALGGVIGAAILNKNQPGGPGPDLAPPPPTSYGPTPPVEPPPPPPPMGGNQ